MYRSELPAFGNNIFPLLLRANENDEKAMNKNESPHRRAISKLPSPA